MTEIANPAGLISELAQRISYSRLAEEIGAPPAELQDYVQTGQTGCTDQQLWRAIGFAYRYGFFDLLPPHGVQPVSYDLRSPFNLLATPVGFEVEPPIVPLIKQPTNIAGYPVDYPLGLPASVLASNSYWIEFYARRGFDILTYKTVRTEYRQEHPWPQWVFLENPSKIIDPSEPEFVGYPGYWPDDLSSLSMANSFGVPSFGPEWWTKDVRRAREVIREGHQVLIVSVVASTNESLDAMTDDFVKAAELAADAGADIVEANYSCPNVPGDQAGDIYTLPAVSSKISAAVKEVLRKTKTPYFVKIGYLPEAELRAFVEANAQHIDGVVAINTIAGKVRSKEGKASIPKNPVTTQSRLVAGISGWAIKERAQEVAKNLVALRDEIASETGKRLTILGVGGVMTSADVEEYLQIGVDGVESCTGAFVNPNLGLDVRIDAEVKRPNQLVLGLKVGWKILEDVVRHPGKTSRIRVDKKTGQVVVEPVER